MSIFLLFQTDNWKSRASRVFFGAFDSIKKCATVIDIPRRRISEIVKEGKIKNGFTVKPLIN